MKVQELMSRQVRTCPIDASLAAAAQVMWDHDVGALPVVGPDGRIAGIITDRDICMAAFLSGAPLASIPVRRHMSRDVFTARPGQSLDSAEELMGAKQVRRLPVIGDAGEVMGMITMVDLARGAGTARKAVDAGEVAATLSRIAQPRPHPGATA